MSELTPCNYCELARIRRREESRGFIVTLRPGGIGTYVHVHRLGEPLDTRDWDAGNKQIVASMQEIGEECSC